MSIKRYGVAGGSLLRVENNQIFTATRAVFRCGSPASLSRACSVAPAPPSHRRELSACVRPRTHCRPTRASPSSAPLRTACARARPP